MQKEKNMKGYSVAYRRSYEDIGEDNGSLPETMLHPKGPKEFYRFGGDTKDIAKDIIRWRIESIFGV